MKNRIQIELGTVRNSCFVVMPFSPLFQIEYEKIIKPCLEDLNIECIRGDEIYSKQRIVDDIWDSIRSCRFVLAELTGKNPNVLYEIGLAHAIGKPVIIITRNGDDVPFDLKALRYLYYDVNDPFWGENLKKGIQNLVSKTLENPEIQKYLDGISHSEIQYPKISENKNMQPPIEEPTFDISGTWFGEYIEKYNTSTVEIRHKVTLQIIQSPSSLSGSCVSTCIYDGQTTVVQQVLNGSLKRNQINLQGVNYTFIERGAFDNYYLDSFILEYNSERNILTGEIISDVSTTICKATIELKRI